MNWIHKINEYIARLEGWLLILITITMVLLSFTQVILRNLFDQGILWGDIFLRHLVLWVGFIGASLATKENKHINIDLFGRLMKGKYQSFIHTITNIFASFISFYLSQAAWRFVMDEREFGTIIFNEVPAWYFQIIIPIGFGLMGMRFALNSLESFISIIKKEKVQP